MLKLFKMKTVWSGIALIGFGAVGLATGDGGGGLEQVIEGLGLIFLRAGVAKGALTP